MNNLEKIIPMAHRLASMLPHKGKKAVFAYLLDDYVVKAEMMFEMQIGDSVILCDGLVFKNFGDNYLSLNPHPLIGEERKDWESILLLPSLKFSTDKVSGKFSNVLNVSWKSKKHKYERVWKFVNEKDMTSAMDFILKMRKEIYGKK